MKDGLLKEKQTPQTRVWAISEGEKGLESSTIGGITGKDPG